MSQLTDKQLTSVFKDLDKLNPYAKFLSESTLSNVDEWFDTGCMVLNSIISGSLYKGIPSGRIIGFTGPSQSGKTYIINKILANAQKAGKIPVIFDTEVAIDKDQTEGVGLDPARVKYVPVETVGDCRNQLFALLDNIIKQGLEGKFIVSIDSLGNLAADKEIEDAEKGKIASDMGLRAKQIKSMMRLLTVKAAKAKTAIIFSNHIYDNPGEMHPSLVKQQSGGRGPEYLASILVQLSYKSEKAEDDQQILTEAERAGVTLTATTIKNRFIPPYLRGKIYLNFKTGLDKYSGLKDLAVAHGVINQNGSTYELADGTKLGYFSKWRAKDELWNDVIFPGIESALKAAYKFGPSDQIEKHEEILGCENPLDDSK